MSLNRRRSNRGSAWVVALTPALIGLLTDGSDRGGGADLPQITRIVFGFGSHGSTLALVSAVLLAPLALALARRSGHMLDVALVTVTLALTAGWAAR